MASLKELCSHEFIALAEKFNGKGVDTEFIRKVNS